MRLYSSHPRLRLTHAGGDLGMLAWAVLWMLVARAVHRAVLVLAVPFDGLADAGGSLSGAGRAALPPGTGAGWRAGDPAAVRALAAVELGRLGLRLPPDGAVSGALPGRPSVSADGPQPR